MCFIVVSHVSEFEKYSKKLETNVPLEDPSSRTHTNFLASWTAAGMNSTIASGVPSARTTNCLVCCLHHGSRCNEKSTAADLGML